MFCPKCGAQLADGALFCPSCGTPLNAPTRSAQPAEQYPQPVQQPVPQYQQPAEQYQQPVQQYQQPVQQYQQPVQQYQQPYQQGYQQPPYGAAGGYMASDQQMRMSNMQEMSRMYDYFSQKAAEYSEYDAINATLDEYDKRRPGLLVWGIILFSIGFFMTVGFAANKGPAGAIVFSVLMMLGATGMILAFVFGTASRKKNKETALIRLVQLTDELHTHFVNFGYCPVGEEFTNPAVLSKIGDNIRSGRANNIRDAINIMFEDAHRTQMEYAAIETMHSARQAAAGATTAAVFAAANFFLR